jgi:hypothetical protein
MMKELRNEKIHVVFFRINDVSLENISKQHNLKIKFEYSGPRTPQSNGRMESKFQTLYGRIQARMNDSGT